MSNYMFSPSENSFYANSLKNTYDLVGTWPIDGLDISDEVASVFMGEPPEGMCRIVLDNGLPAWGDIPPPTHDELVVAAENQKQWLIDEAMQSISLIQLKLQAGRKLTASEAARLNAVLDYIDAVAAIDTNTAPDVNWPSIPAE